MENKSFGKEDVKKERSEDSSSEKSDSDSDSDSDTEPLELKLDQHGRVLADTSQLNYSFRSFVDILGVSNNSEKLKILCKDISTASTKSRDMGNDYSEGQTFWVPANAAPTTILEKIALEIFQFHTKGCQFDKENSGAEWWTLAIDSENADVSWHWDKDYGLEESGINLSPHLATITYLSETGAPTVMLNKIAPTEYHKDISGTASKMFLSRPRIGKHSSFDGRFLHAAPIELSLWNEDGTVSGKNGSDSGGSDGGGSDGGGSDGGGSDGGGSDNDRSNISGTSRNESKKVVPLRYSFLVNIWLNWKPQDAIVCPKKLIKTLSTNDLNDNMPQINFSNESEIKILEFDGMKKNATENNTVENDLSWDFTVGDQKANIHLSVLKENVRDALINDVNIGSLLVVENSKNSVDINITNGIPLVVVETVKESASVGTKRKRVE